MSLRERIPEQLRLADDAYVSITLDEDIGVFPTSEYVLLEVSHKAGRIDFLKVAATAHDLVKADRRIVAIRGFGFKGTGLTVRIAHEIKKREKRFVYRMTFDTFEATDETGRPQTSIQIVIIPPEK